MTVAAGTVALNVNHEGQFKARGQNPYLPDQNDLKRCPTYDQNGWQTTPYVAQTREYPRGFLYNKYFDHGPVTSCIVAGELNLFHSSGGKKKL